MVDVRYERREDGLKGDAEMGTHVLSQMGTRVLSLIFFFIALPFLLSLAELFHHSINQRVSP